MHRAFNEFELSCVHFSDRADDEKPPPLSQNHGTTFFEPNMIGCQPAEASTCLFALTLAAVTHQFVASRWA